MNTIDKRVRFAFEAVSELPQIKDQLSEILNLTTQQEARTRAMASAFQAAASGITSNLTGIRSAQQQTTAAIQTGSTQQVNALGLVNQSVTGIGRSFTEVRNLIGLAFSLAEIKAFGEGVIDAKSKTDVFRLGLTQMLQSQRDVAELYPKLLQMAQTTPFQVEELIMY